MGSALNKKPDIVAGSETRHQAADLEWGGSFGEMIVPGFGLLPRASALHARASFEAPKCNIIIEQTRRLMLTIIPSREDCPFPLSARAIFRLKASFWTSRAVIFCHRQRTSSLRCLSLSLPACISFGHSFFTFCFADLCCNVVDPKVAKARPCSLPVWILVLYCLVFRKGWPWRTSWQLFSPCIELHVWKRPKPPMHVCIDTCAH